MRAKRTNPTSPFQRCASILCLFSLSFSVLGQVQLNEVVPQDFSRLADEEGKYSGWIELVNRGTETVDLKD